MRRRWHMSERTADVIALIILILSIVGLLSIVKWVVAFCAYLFFSVVIG